jgi:hypothetical protein
LNVAARCWPRTFRRKRTTEASCRTGSISAESSGPPAS